MALPLLSSIAGIITKTLLTLIGKAVSLYWAYRGGRQAQELRENKKLMERIDEARKIRDRVELDDDYRQRVRDKYDQ